MSRYRYEPTDLDPANTEVDVICKKCGKKVDQICEEALFFGIVHKKCDCGS